LSAARREVSRRHHLRNLLDNPQQFLGPVAVAPGELDQFASLLDHGGALGPRRSA
jgi:hypothetical protein